MKVLHVIPGLAQIYGGPSFSTTHIAEALAVRGINVDVATTTANGSSELRVPLDRPVVDEGVRYFYFTRQHPRSWTFSWPLTRWLAQHVQMYDVLHVHALFSYPTLPACWAARNARVPYVLSPHGMLDPWSLRFHTWKKVPYLRILERRNLCRAAAIHTTSHQERRAVEALDLPVYAVTIPYGIHPSTVRDSEGTYRRGRTPDEVVKLLFLSRLHPKKGIELLLEAVDTLTQELHLRLFIAGDGDAAYVESLRQRVRASGLEDRVIFTGFVTGAEKQALFEHTDLFVLPSYDENFGMAVAEALSVGLPVVVSEHVGLADHVRDAGAGLVVPCDARELAQGIAMFVTDPGLRRRMGQAGRRLAETEFSWPEVARRLIVLYEQLVASRIDGNSVVGRKRARRDEAKP